MVATNLDSLEYLGNSVQPWGKIVTNKIVSPDVVSGLQKCSKIHLQLVLCPEPCWGSLQCFLRLSLLQLSFVTITYRSKLLPLEKPGILREFFSSTLWPLCSVLGPWWRILPPSARFVMHKNFTVLCRTIQH